MHNPIHDLKMFLTYHLVQLRYTEVYFHSIHHHSGRPS